MILKFILAQINLTVADIAGNTRKIIQFAQSARDEQQASVVVFPELALTGYPPGDLLLRQDFASKVEQALQEIMVAVPNVTIILGYPRCYDVVRYNCAGVIRNGSLLAEYHKQALPNYGVFDEKRYFDAGTEPCVVVLEGIKVGITICEDIWMSEPVGKACVAGAQLIVNINASPFRIGKHCDREAQVRQRIVEVQVPIIYLNLVGGQDELIFDGGSFVMNVAGQITQRGPCCVEAAIPVNIYTAYTELGRMVIEPRFGAMLSYPADEVAVYRAIVLGVYDFVQKNGFKGAIVGLSGGIDSALTLAIAVDALGANRVEAVLMPSRYTAAMSNEDAVEIATVLNVAWREISIEPVYETFLNLLSSVLIDKNMGVTEENIQARCRGVILMAISNKSGKVLLTTGNKSELAVGYATLYGDMAGGFAPIKDIFKTYVYQLARYRNSLKSVIPQRILERPPSAELRPNQTDQDSLPPYAILDAILQLYIECDQSVTEIVAAGFDSVIVERVVQMVNRSEHKRHQAPLGVRVTRRAFGKDRRYPITSGFDR